MSLFLSPEGSFSFERDNCILRTAGNSHAALRVQRAPIIHIIDTFTREHFHRRSRYLLRNAVCRVVCEQEEPEGGGNQILAATLSHDDAPLPFFGPSRNAWSHTKDSKNRPCIVVWWPDGGFRADMLTGAKHATRLLYTEFSFELYLRTCMSFQSFLVLVPRTHGSHRRARVLAKDRARVFVDYIFYIGVSVLTNTNNENTTKCGNCRLLL